MKNKFLQFTMAFLALLSVAYYTALQISDPGPVIGFTLILLVFGLVFASLSIAGDRIIEKIGYFFRRHRSTGIGIGIFCALFCAVSAGILWYICLPLPKGSAQKSDYLLVLGGGIRKNGDPSNSLQKRLDRAAEYMLENPGIIVIVSGGQSKKTPWAEAETMARFLEEKTAYDEKLIIKEDKSKDTIQNFAFSRALMKGTSPRVLIVTNEFHLRRAMILARMQGYTNIDGLPAPSPLLSGPISYLREVGAYWKLGIRTCIDFCIKLFSRQKTGIPKINLL